MKSRNEKNLKSEVEALVTKVKTVQISEALKSPDKSDAELVSECTAFILEAEDRALNLSEAEIKSRVAKIPFVNTEKRRSFNRRKIITAAVIAAVIFILLVVTGTAVRPIRNYFTKVTDDGTFFSFGVTDTNDYLYGKFTYIPEGYTLDPGNNIEDMHKTIYSYGENKIYIISGTNKNSGTYINTENAIETKEIPIGKHIGYYTKNDEATFLLWSTGKYYHVIIADNCDSITEDELVKIALSREKA